MAVEHAAQHEGRHRQGLLVHEPQPQIPVESCQAVVAARAVHAIGCRMEEDGHIQLHACSPHVVEGWIVERATEIRAYVGGQQTEAIHRPVQLRHRACRVLHG